MGGVAAGGAGLSFSVDNAQGWREGGYETRRTFNLISLKAQKQNAWHASGTQDTRVIVLLRSQALVGGGQSFSVLSSSRSAYKQQQIT